MAWCLDFQPVLVEHQHHIIAFSGQLQFCHSAIRFYWLRPQAVRKFNVFSDPAVCKLWQLSVNLHISFAYTHGPRSLCITFFLQGVNLSMGSLSTQTKCNAGKWLREPSVRHANASSNRYLALYITCLSLAFGCCLSQLKLRRSGKIDMSSTKAKLKPASYRVNQSFSLFFFDVQCVVAFAVPQTRKAHSRILKNTVHLHKVSSTQCSMLL